MPNQDGMVAEGCVEELIGIWRAEEVGKVLWRAIAQMETSLSEGT